MAAKKRRKRRKVRRRKATPNAIAKRELDLFMESTGELYPMKKAILTNLGKKRARGLYDATKAPKAWEHWVDRGAQQYQKEFGSDAPIFDRATKRALSEDLEKRYRKGE